METLPCSLYHYIKSHLFLDPIRGKLFQTPQLVSQLTINWPCWQCVTKHVYLMEGAAITPQSQHSSSVQDWLWRELILLRAALMFKQADCFQKAAAKKSNFHPEYLEKSISQSTDPQENGQSMLIFHWLGWGKKQRVSGELGTLG